MQRFFFLRILFILGLTLMFSVAWLASPTGAQDNSEDLTTRVAALETQVSVLQTQVVQEQPNSAGATGTPIESPDTSSQPVPGTVLYQTSSTEGGFEDWAAPGWNRFQGMLTADGSVTSTGMLDRVFAPYELDRIVDYAIEAEIQTTSCGFFGIFVRGEEEADFTGYVSCNAGYLGYVTPQDNDTIGDTFPFEPDDYWHTFRLEVIGNTITYLIDGNVVNSAEDNRLIAEHGGKVGFWNNGVPINIRSFRIIAL